MATTEFEEPSDLDVSWAQAAVVRTKTAVGADERLSIRAIIALVVLGVVTAFAPFPLAAVGAIALVVLVLEVARMAWRKK